MSETFNQDQATDAHHAYGLEVVKNHLIPSSEVGIPGMWLTDLDNTVKESQKHVWPDGKARKIIPETIAAFKVLHSVRTIGVVTEQSVSEMLPWLQDAAELITDTPGVNPFEVFNGLIVCEGGNVIIKPGFKEPIILSPSGALYEKEQLWKWLTTPGVIVSSGEDGWGSLQGVDPLEGTFVMLPSKEDQGIATISLWEKGQLVSQDPTAISKYNMVKSRVDAALAELGLTKLTTYEAGNGTLRIVPKFVNKGHTMGLFKAFNLINPEHVIYSCDGPNDIGFAQYVKKHGGAVVAVGNAVNELQQLSDVNAKGSAGLGFAEIIQQLFPTQYHEALEHVQKQAYIRKFAGDMVQVAPDLKSNNLAFFQAAALLEKLWNQGAHQQQELVLAGQQEWYHIGKDILGPIMVCFVDQALQHVPANGIAIFPARDATPFYHIAKQIQLIDPDSVTCELVNPVFNRKLWGVEDEQDPENGVVSIHAPIAKAFLAQMGIGSDKPISFIEVGAYGTMVRALKEAGYYNFGVQFFFSQVPFIPGFINSCTVGLDVPNGTEETLADSLEGLPKTYKRPTKLVMEQDGTVTVSLEGKIVDSPFLEPWQLAFIEGLKEATNEYISQNKHGRSAFDPYIFAQKEIMKLSYLSQQSAQTGEFTGVLPRHTESWSEKQSWIEQWNHDFGSEIIPFA